MSAKTEEIKAQAAHLEQVMPAIAQRLFAIAPPHPLADMPVGQVRLCSLLLSSETYTLSRIADELHISVSAVSQMADRLEKAGLVERLVREESCGECDRRTRTLRLTQKGIELMQSRRELRQKGALRALQHLSDQDRRLLLEQLNKLREASLHSEESGENP